jgi:hypothetical protein
MIILALVVFVHMSYAFCLSLLFEWSMLVLWGCLSSIDEILCSLLQGELASLVEFDAWFDLPWFRGSMVFCIAFLAAILSLKLGVCHPHCLV